MAMSLAPFSDSTLFAMHHDLKRIIVDAGNDSDVAVVWRDDMVEMQQLLKNIAQELIKRNQPISLA